MRGLLALGILGAMAAWIRADPGIRWDPATRTVEASLEKDSLVDVLISLSSQTGWQVWIEPELEAELTMRFGPLPAHRALRRILGVWNFALMQDREGRPKLCVYRNSAAAAIKRLEAPEPDARIDNELILTFGSGSEAEVRDMARSLRAQIVGSIEGHDAWLFRFKDAESADRARELLAHEDGIDVADNYRLPGLSPDLGAGPPILDPFQVRANPEVGEDTLVVALLDTQVQQDAPGLSDFLLDPVVLGEGQEAPLGGEPTHGTTMALTLLEGIGQVVANEPADVRILPVDIYGSAEETSTFQVAAGIVAGLKMGAGVFSLSLGGEESAPFLRDIVAEAHSQGVVFIGAAGNEGGTREIFPAAYPEFLAVTSSLPDGSLAPYANNGTFVDVVAPGHSHIAYDGSTYLIQGTSVSAASVAGVTAGLASQTDLSLRQVESQLRRSLPQP